MSYKPEPWQNPGEVEIKPTTEELLEEIIETDDETQTSQKEEIYDDYKKKPEVEAETTPAPQPDQVKEPVKIEEPLSDDIRCESGPHHYRCYDNEENLISSDIEPINGQ